MKGLHFNNGDTRLKVVNFMAYVLNSFNSKTAKVAELKTENVTGLALASLLLLIFLCDAVYVIN